jgi:homoserine dehydrogenase
MSKVKVGLIGFGVVGRGFAAALIGNREIIYKKSGIDIELSAIADVRAADLDDALLEKTAKVTTDANEIVEDKSINIVVELVGGYTFAKDFILKAIDLKKHVVTANKALLAKFGKDIFSIAEKNNVAVGFEASCGGGIPIIKVLKEDLAANNIEEICAIINGTANYILTKMTIGQSSYEDALKDAQRLGYAEADPTFDVEGIDSAHKITLLSSIAFGAWVEFENVYTEGITRISPVDIAFAKELGCTIKLLAIGKKTVEGLDVRVHPTIITNNFRLASVNDSFNALQIKGDIVGETFHYGRGAGSLPTGSAVAADVISIARDIVFGSVGRVSSLGFNKTAQLDIIDIDIVRSSFYLRFSTTDKPGALAGIAGNLAMNGISIRSALQRPTNEDDGTMPVVFLTHETTGKQIKKALDEIELFPNITEKPVAIRVEGIK